MQHVNIQQNKTNFSGRVTNEIKTQNLTTFKLNLFANFYKTSNFLSIVHNMCIFFAKSKTPPVAVLKNLKYGF